MINDKMEEKKMNKEQQKISNDYETTILVLKNILYNQMIIDIEKAK